MGQEGAVFKRVGGGGRVDRAGEGRGFHNSRCIRGSAAWVGE